MARRIGWVGGVSGLAMLLACGSSRTESRAIGDAGAGAITATGGSGGSLTGGSSGSSAAGGKSAGAGGSGGVATAGTSSAGTSGQSGSIGNAGGVGGTGGVSGRGGDGGINQTAGEAGMVSDAGEGGVAGTPSFPPKPLCGGTISPGNEPWCVGIESVVLSRGAIADTDMDGRVAPGEEASVTIAMQNTSTTESYNYPCIGLLSSDPDVTVVGGEARDNPAWNFFGIPAGQTLEVEMFFQFAETMTSGKQVRFLAWLDVLNSGCTNGNEVEFSIGVQ